MKKIIIMILLIITIIGGYLVIKLFEKNNEYVPEVDYQDDIIWEDIESSHISFDGTNIIGDNIGYTTKENKLIIKSGGSYYLSGDFEGNIEVDTKSEVYLILNNLNINSNNNPAVNIKNSEKVIIKLEEQSINTLKDNNTNAEENATIYSTDDLVIMGTGELNINANNHAIRCNDSLQIIEGTYNINANNDAIRVKDYLAIKSGTFNINTLSDGIKATNDKDSTLGYIVIDGGTFNINVANDAISAITNLTINDGTFNLITNKSTDSSKGIKSDGNITLNNGTFTLNTYDDAIHANNVYINNGTFEIKSGDDAIHGDSILKIETGTVNITESYEGLEATEITINNGDIRLNSTDDGINCAGGNDSSGMGGMYGRPSDMFHSSNGKLYINDGYVYVDAKGDGIDINGSGEINNGTVIVSGPTTNGNGSLDYDATFNINGGLFIATGSSGMMQSPSNSSKQNVLAISFNNTLNNAVCIDGILAILPNKNYQSLIISSPKLESNKTYSIYTNCEVSDGKDGIYEKYTFNTLYKNVTISNTVTTIGNSNGMGGHPGGMIPGRR